MITAEDLQTFHCTNEHDVIVMNPRSMLVDESYDLLSMTCGHPHILLVAYPDLLSSVSYEEAKAALEEIVRRGPPA